MEARRLFAADFVSDAAGFGTSETVNVNGTSYFFADNGLIGRELWKSDGTAAGTVQVKDLTPGIGGTSVVAFFHAGGRAVFITQAHAEQEIDDYAVWSSDGTAAGTIKLGEFNSSYLEIRQVGERVAFFVMRNSPVVEGYTDSDLYFTDGTAAGTTLVKRFVATPESPGVPSRSYSIDSMHVAGNRIVFGIGSERIWASDGTAAGTIDLTPIVGYNGLIVWATSLLHMEEFEGKVLIPTTERKLWVTDGTVAGTFSIAFDVPRLETSKIVGHTYFFQTQGVAADGREIVKKLHALDLRTGVITELLGPPGEDSSKSFWLNSAGGRLLFSISTGGSGDVEMWSSDGTVAGTVKLGSFNRDNGQILASVSVADRAYFLVSTGGLDLSLAPDEGITAFLSAIGGWGRSVNVQGGQLELWATDGTVGGTGLVRVAWSGDADGKYVAVGISEVAGKLAIRTKISTGVTSNTSMDWTPNLKTVWDDTLIYSPEELSLARDGAIAKVVNGVLRLNGSMGPDNFRVYRLVSDPSQLVVEYNGNKRVFAFNTIRRIVADLQDGNDKLDIVEYEGSEIRLWTSILGGDGADTIFAGTGRDTIIGGSGGDTIRSRGNADAIIGGGGRDRITSGQGDDIIVGGSGHDSIIAGTGHDVLFGQNAVEQVFGKLWDDGDTLEDLVLQSF